MAINDEKDPYAALGVSSSKEGVHKATKRLYKGLYPGAFCIIVPMPSNMPKEIIDEYAQIIHSDGVGTKSNVAYLAKMEGLGNDFFRKLPQDALVMNTDDIACVGAIDNIFISNHISRNANRINDNDLCQIIDGYSDFYEHMASLGFNIISAGGETADVGSYVTTVGIDVTSTAVIKKTQVIDCSNIKPNQYIVGLSSYGKSTYETVENSGIRSNGSKLASNILLNPYYRRYKEIIDQTIAEELQMSGKYYLTDDLKGTSLTIGEALLSPTRTYLPVIRDILKRQINISGMIHCSGGGLTKSIGFGNNIRYVKDGLDSFKTPNLFKEIQEMGNIDDKYMYKTFNMGVGMEIIVNTEADAYAIIAIANKYNVDAAIIGTTEKAPAENEVLITNNGKTLIYKKGDN